MSTFSLTKGSEAALGMLASQAGTETLLLTQPARELRAELSIEPFTSDSGDQLLAVLFMREQRHSMTLQCNDGANVQHLADWVEAVANGTLDTAEAIPHRADPGDLQAATAAFNAAAHELNAQQAELVVYRAINQFGSDCHFGVESLARVWAGPKGTVERVTLKPVPELSVVAARPAQTEQRPEQSALEQALALAAARLDRLGLNQPVASKAYHEARGWADEAMVALRDYRAALATSPTA